MKNVKTPNRRIFFRRSALIFLWIHKVWLRQIALIGEKISRRWAFRHLSNKPTAALESGKIGAVGIDVWEKEPVSMEDPILQSDHAILTSHCAYYSVEANLDLRIKSLMTAVNICKGEMPYNCVNQKALAK